LCVNVKLAIKLLWEGGGWKGFPSRRGLIIYQEL